MNAIKMIKDPHDTNLDDTTEKSIKKAKLEKYLKDRFNSDNDSASRKLPDEEEW